MKRDVQPELLDQLPPNDPRARASRKDIGRLSQIAGAPGWWARTLKPFMQPGMRLLELGASEGVMAERLRRQLPGVQVDGLDLCPKPANWPADCKWWQCDVREFTGYAMYDAVIANFMMHHFSDAELGRLGAQLQRGPRLLAFFEPRRRKHLLWVFPALAKTLRMNPVTLHDGAVSIRAGFAGDELANALGLGPGWRYHSHGRWRGGYTLVADRFAHEISLGEETAPAWG